jgi:signal transduction histidine kinase
MTTGRLRSRLLLCAAAPLAAAGVVALTPLGAGAGLGLAAAGAAGALGVALGLAVVTRPLASLAAECGAVAGGAAPPATLPADRPDELGTIARALRELDGRRQRAADAHRAAVETNRAALDAYRATVAEFAAALAQLGDGGAAAPPAASGPCATELQGLGGVLTDAAKKLATVRQRLTATARMLQHLPAPVIAVDGTGAVKYLSADAERAVARSNAACLRKPFADLLAEPGPSPDPFGRPVLGPAAVAEWFKAGAPGEAVVAVARGADPPVRAALVATPTVGADGLRYVVARDLTGEYAGVARDRAAVREEALRAAWAATARAATEPLEAVLASARLLAADAKQSSGRDALVPRAAAVRRHAGGLEAYVRTVRWLHAALGGELPAPVAAEFRAGEPVRAAVEQLAPRFAARNLAAAVSDEGGWVCGDDEWVRTALLGVLAHAADAAQDGTVGVRVRRRPPTAADASERVAFEVVDAGPPLTAAQRADLDRPFGDLHPPTYLEAGAAGFVPGLLLARTLAGLMGGVLEFDTTPGGGLVVRITLPTRLPGAVPAGPAAEPLDAGPAEELVMGWRLGVA